MIDTHAHLYVKEYDEDRDAMLQRTFESGVKKIFLPNIDLSTIPAMQSMQESYPDQCYAMLGLHPCDVKSDFESVLDQMESLLSTYSWYGIGETGLDYYWDTTYKEEQKSALKRQISWAKKFRLPIILHTRNSFEDTIQIIENEKDENLHGIFHCFGGSQNDAQRVIDIGFKMGIGGVVTYKNGGLDQLLPYIDIQHLVLETDSPYLTPVPYRGKRNESSYLKLIAERIASIKNIAIEEVIESTTENALKLFTK